MKALLIVDIQNDFCPGGSLSVKDGDAIIEPVNRLIQSFTAQDYPVVFTRDWHPANHSSFADLGGIWPSHCVSNTEGAAFHPDLKIPDNAIIISKAEAPSKDVYSGFEDTYLNDKLTALGVNSVVVVGLATDYCVKNTVLDALRNGYKTIVAEDCIKAVNVNPGDGAKAITRMSSAGAEFKLANNLIN